MDVKAEKPRPYFVTTATGQQYHRNRKDLLQTGEPPPTLSVPEDNDHHTTETDTETQTTQGPATNEQPHVTVFSNKSPTPPTRRTSSRTKTLPAKFKDYAMNFLNIEPCIIELCVIAFYRICRSLLSNSIIITDHYGF